MPAIGKILVKILRHSAVKEWGLEIGTDGYIKLDHILKHPRISKLHEFKDIDLEKIKQCVTECKKKRMQLDIRNGIYYIRATQGHSIQSIQPDKLLNPIGIEFTDNVIHGTYLKSIGSILKNGLSRMDRNMIHFTNHTPKSNKVISGMRGSSQVLIYIDLPLAIGDGIKFWISHNGVILSYGNKDGCLEPKYFKKIVYL